jgi:hypothetical protein
MAKAKPRKATRRRKPRPRRKAAPRRASSHKARRPKVRTAKAPVFPPGYPSGGEVVPL